MTLEKLLSIPKSLYVGFRLFSLKEEIKLPILVRYNVKLLNISGLIKVNGEIKTAMISIGFGRVGIFDKKYERTILEIAGCIEIYGQTGFGHGTRISVAKGAILSIGENFSNTAEITLVCKKHISIGKSVTTSWNTLIMDTDWHETINTETHIIGYSTKPIIIGDYCWIGTRSVILKGSILPKGCIVAANSLVCKQYKDDNCLIAGNPAVIKKYNITMHRDF